MMLLRSIAALACTLAAAGCATAPAVRNDFPTVDRVVYVQECMRANPGPYYEMVNKCSCALDRFAEEVKFDEYVEMSTIVNAMTIGGERGSELRDNETIKPAAKRYRELQAQVQKACLIAPR
jgi:hypothetical protein